MGSEKHQGMARPQCSHWQIVREALSSPRFCYYVPLETFNRWHLEIRRGGSEQGSNPKASTSFTCRTREITDLSIPETPPPPAVNEALIFPFQGSCKGETL